MLRLLHLSDIHFRNHPPPWDADEDQRAELILDVKRLVEQGGRLDGILVGGDIAFSGAPDEYEKARVWLEELVAMAQCPESSVWMVPGNHDVERSTVERSEMIKALYSALRQCDVGEITDLLRRKLQGDPAAGSLFAHLQGYNDFARVRGCEISPSKPYWDDFLDLDGHGVLLRGVNSVVCSDESDSGFPFGAPTQFLGHQQAEIRRDLADIRIVLCHHPPTWLRDWPLVENYMDRAHVALFGHMHTRSVEQSRPGAPLRIHAGAVGPDRDPSWAPTYNLIELTKDGGRLEVSVQARVWDPTETCFKLAEHGAQDFYVDLGGRTTAVEDTQDTEPINEELVLATPLVDTTVGAGPVTESLIRLRDLVYRYLSLPITRRLEIADRLGVLGDLDVSHGDPFPAILTRVRERNLIDRLAEELER